jgi:hypothetical protein
MIATAKMLEVGLTGFLLFSGRNGVHAGMRHHPVQSISAMSAAARAAPSLSTAR